MQPERDGDRIIAPKRAESADGQVIGDGWVILEPGDPDYAKWDAHLRVLEGGDGGWSDQLSNRMGGGR